MRQALARMLCPVVRRRPLVVGRRNVDRLCATTDPQLVALLEAQGDGVVGVLEGDMAVVAHGDCFPDCQVVRRWRQRLEPRPLGFLEAHQRLLLDRAVNAQPGGGVAPDPHVLIGLGDERGLAPAQEVAFHEMHAALLDLTLVLRRGHAARCNQEAVVLGAFPVRLLNQRVVKTGSHHGGLQVIRHDPLRRTAQELERVPVAEQPGFDLLVEHQLNVLVAAPGQRHDKGPGPAQLARGRVQQQPGVTKVHLAFLARPTLDPHHDFRLRCRFQAVHEPAHSRVTTAVTAFQQALKDGRHFDPFLAQLLDRRTVRFHRRAVLWRLGFGQRLVDQLLQPGQRGERGFRQQPLLRGPGPVPFHGLSMHSGCPLHHTVLVALPHLQHQFADVHGLFSPVRHRPSQLPATCSAGKDTGCAGVAPSAWYTLADYSRYTLADYGWYTLADSRWYSIARLLTVCLRTLNLCWQAWQNKF